MTGSGNEDPKMEKRVGGREQNEGKMIGWAD